MSSNIREFDLALAKDAREWPAEQVEKVHRAVALEALKGVVRMTPVDTGRARANWQVSQDAPATGEVDATDKPGAATIGAGSVEIAAARPFTVTYVTNNLPYIEELEGGSSKQAPAGMLNVTYNRLRGWLARQR